MTANGTIVVVSPYRTEYGPRAVLEHVTEAIAESGFRAVLAVPDGAELTPSLLERSARIQNISGLTTIPRTVNVFRLGAFLRGHLAAARAIQALAGEENAIAIYATSEATFCGGLAARRLEVPSIVHAIGMSINKPPWVAAAYIRFLDRMTDMFIACSSAVSEMFAAHGVDERKNTVVHNGVDAARIRIEALAAEVGVGVGVAHDGPAVGMIAAYDSRKGHELFVDACAIVADRHPNARFYIIGGVLPGQSESVRFERRVVARIEALGIADRFERVGYVGAPGIYGWIRAMDVIVVPSRTEAFAHALLEAMICERPIVASAIEGNLDAFVDGLSGIYATRDAERFAEAISQLLADADRAAAMGRAAARHAARLFDLSVTVSANAQVIQELLAE
jgi:glycosyltransferase involved in cell wall biosynthesis